MTRAKLAAILTIVGSMCLALAQLLSPGVPRITPVDSREGWAGPAEVANAAPIVAAMPAFQIVDPVTGAPIVQDNSRANVRLWEYSKAVNGGKHLPNIAQQVGDCVSWGARNAIQYVQCVQIVRDGQRAEFHEVYAPFIYGVSRVIIGGGRLKGDGSVGAWAAEGSTRVGIIPSDFPGLLPYSGKIAREWGKSGPPKELVAAAAKFRIKTTSLARSAEQMRDGICNGYGGTCASDFGSTDIRARDGRMVARRNTRWMHQMCVDGYDGSGTQRYFHILNSWGPDAHPAPIDDSPPGGFWITWEDMEYICRQGDSFIFSSFDGFPAQELRVFGVTKKEVDHVVVRPDRRRKTTLAF